MSSVVTVIEIGTEAVFFFSNIEPYWNHGFRLSVDGFNFHFWNLTALVPWLCYERS